MTSSLVLVFRKRIVIFVEKHNPMKKLLSVLVVLALAVSCTSHKAFRFVQMTDPQIGFIDNTPLYHKTDSLLQAAVKKY